MKVLLCLACTVVCLASGCSKPPNGSNVSPTGTRPATDEPPVSWQLVDARPSADGNLLDTVIMVDEKTPKAEALELGEWIVRKHGTDQGGFEIVDSWAMVTAMRKPPPWPEAITTHHWLVSCRPGAGNKVVWMAKSRDH